MTTIDRAELLERCKALRTEVSSPGFGICKNLDYPTCLPDLFRTPGFFDHYPYFSGLKMLPVQHPTLDEGYLPGVNKWEGEYGFRRYALLEYIIMKLEKENGK
jgi:hypothetical protein